MNLSTFAVAGQVAWKKAKPIIIRDTFLLPLAGFAGLIAVWWIIALFRPELMPTPPQALMENLDYIFSSLLSSRAWGFRFGLVVDS